MSYKMFTPGDRLGALITSATHQIMLVAPYIKVDALKRLLNNAPKCIPLKCITCWRPEDIVVGVTDLEIWPLIKKWDNSSLLLHPNLHAKYYRFDEKCLVGSANLTLSALGWSSNPNLELMVELPFENSDLVSFEKRLISDCIKVDDSLYNFMKEAICVLKKGVLSRSVVNKGMFSDNPDDSGHTVSVSFAEWFPTSRNPEDLYIAYAGYVDDLTSSARASAFLDLKALGISISGLSLTSFKAYVGAILLQHPIIRQVDEFVKTPQRFGAVRDFLTALLRARNQDFDATRGWQTLMRWLIYFIPDRYILSVPHYTEVFCRIKE